MREILIDFGIPALVLVLLFILLVCGINGEVKTLFAGTVGWIIKSGVTKRSNQNLTPPTPTPDP